MNKFKNTLIILKSKLSKLNIIRYLLIFLIFVCIFPLIVYN